MRKSFRLQAVTTLIVLASAVVYAKREFVMPATQVATAYPAHDEHKDEGVAVAIDPYDMPDKAKVFIVDYAESGYLPILLVVTNNTDQPISLAGMKAQFVTVDRVKLAPAREDDLYRRLSRPARNDGPSPLPFPRKKVKGAVGREALDELKNSQFGAKAVEPHSSQAGFLFFEVGCISTPLPGAQFYLTGARNAKGEDLLYFEIPLEKYLSAPAAAPAASQ